LISFVQVSYVTYLKFDDDVTYLKFDDVTYLQFDDDVTYLHFDCDNEEGCRNDVKNKSNLPFWFVFFSNSSNLLA
jgi:hypothetical protein